MVAKTIPWIKLLVDIIDNIDFKTPNINYPKKERKERQHLKPLH